MVADFKKKQKILERILVPLGAVLLLVICGLLIIFDLRINNERNKFTLQVQNLKDKVEDIKNKNEELEKGIDNTDNNDYIEKIAREELDLQKPSEKVVSFIQSENENPNGDNEKKSPLEVWQSWIGGTWQWFKNLF